MKFPITRQALQNFDPVQEKKNRDDLAIKIQINSIVEKICGEIQEQMEWTGPSLSTMRSAFNHAHIGHDTKEKHDKIMKDKRFVWDGLRTIRYSTTLELSESVLIPLLIEKLKETFIGCDIIIDPLKTYIIIDWSEVQPAQQVQQVQQVPPTA